MGRRVSARRYKPHTDRIKPEPIWDNPQCQLPSRCLPDLVCSATKYRWHVVVSRSFFPNWHYTSANKLVRLSARSLRINPHQKSPRFEGENPSTLLSKVIRAIADQHLDLPDLLTTWFFSLQESRSHLKSQITGQSQHATPTKWRNKMDTPFPDPIQINVKWTELEVWQNAYKHRNQGDNVFFS